MSILKNKLIRQELRSKLIDEKSDDLNHSAVRLCRKSMFEARRKVFSKIPTSLIEPKAMTFKNKNDFIANNGPF